MGELSESRRLPSSAEVRLRQLRRDLVLQLYMKHGPLWEAICDVRDRWSISARVELPPSAVGQLLPEDAPAFDERKKYTEYADRWEDEMLAIKDKVDLKPYLPTREWLDYQLEVSWKNFLSACVLYDPPDDRLIEFADYGNLEPTFLSNDPFPKKDNLHDLPEMVNPPIKSLWGLMEVRDWYWHRVFDHIGEKYLEPQGVDVETLLENAVLCVPGLYEEHLERYEQYSKRYYIEVDEYTSLEDVRSVFRMIRSIQRPKKRTKPPRDRLTAVQCAVLYDCHNQREPEDKRRWRWTHAKLAKEFRLSPRAAKAHIVLGREILNERDPDKI